SVEKLFPRRTGLAEVLARPDANRETVEVWLDDWRTMVLSEVDVPSLAASDFFAQLVAAALSHPIEFRRVLMNRKEALGSGGQMLFFPSEVAWIERALESLSQSAGDGRAESLAEFLNGKPGRWVVFVDTAEAATRLATILRRSLKRTERVLW